MSDLELLKSHETNMHESLTGVRSIRTNKIWILVISMLQQLEITTHQFLSLFRNKVQSKQTLFLDQPEERSVITANGSTNFLLEAKSID